MKMVVGSGNNLALNWDDGEGGSIDVQFGVDQGSVGGDNVNVILSDFLLSESSNH